MIGEFPNRIRTAACLLPPVWSNDTPRLLDACTQFVEPWLAEVALQRGYRLTVCDIAPEEPGVVKVDLTKQLPWPDRWFRGIICTDTLEHVQHYEMALREFARVTEPGGFLMLHLPWRGTPPNLAVETAPQDPDEDTHHHCWAFGTDLLPKVDAAGFRLVGGVWSNDDMVFHLSYLYLFARK